MTLKDVPESETEKRQLKSWANVKKENLLEEVQMKSPTKDKNICGKVASQGMICQ